MLNFETTPRKQLRARLKAAGWSQDKKAEVTYAGQLHQWRPSPRPKDTERRTLRNACRIAGIAR